MPDSLSPDATFTALVASYGATMTRIARAYAGGHGEADDLYQEILFQVWRGLPTFRGDSAAGTWLYRVALNTALGWRRKAVRRNAVEQPVVVNVEISGATTAEGAEAEILEAFLASLTPVDRSILILYMEGTSQREIGDVIGISEGAVGVRIHRIKGLFKQRHLGA